MNADVKRLSAYAERFFQKSARTKFPTVRQAARSLRWTQERVETAIYDSDSAMMLTAYNGTPVPTLGDHFVEVLCP